MAIESPLVRWAKILKVNAVNKILLFLICFFSSSTHLFSQVITIDEKSPRAINITDQLEYLIDEDRALELNGLSQFTTLGDNFMDFGFTKARIWLRFEVRNLTGNKLFLTLNNRLTDRVAIIINPNRAQEQRVVSGGESSLYKTAGIEPNTDLYSQAKQPDTTGFSEY